VYCNEPAVKVRAAASNRGITPNTTTADDITCPYSVIISFDKRYCLSARLSC